MTSRPWIPIVAAVIVAAVCVRLGLWQLDRLAQRKERNAIIASGFQATPLPIDSALRTSSTPRFRRVTVRGRWDYAREQRLSGRTRSGSPGVHVLTPLLLDDDGPSILVNRGWVYSPDANTVDLAQWREGDIGAFVGYLDEVPKAATETGAYAAYVVALGDASSGTAAAHHPARLHPPPFGELGPHLNYAVQWFSFAAIALIGTPLVVRRQRRRRGAVSIVSDTEVRAGT